MQSFSDYASDKCKKRSMWSFLFLSQLMFTAFGLFALGYDVNFGLNTSNSKFVSFVHSIHCCFSYKQLRAKTYDPQVRWKRFLFALLGKHGGSTSISILLLKLPVLFKSPRHILTFAAAFFIVEQPFFEEFCRTLWINLVIKLSVALYRLRKILFIVSVTSNFAELECPAELLYAFLHYWRGLTYCTICSVLSFLGGRFYRHLVCGKIQNSFFGVFLWFWRNRGFAISCIGSALLFYGTVIQSTFHPLFFKVGTLLVFYLQYIGADLTVKRVLPELAVTVSKRLSDYDKQGLSVRPALVATAKNLKETSKTH